MPKMYNWSIIRSGAGLRVIGLFVMPGFVRSQHKLQCERIELIDGEVIATVFADGSQVRLMLTDKQS